MRNFMYAAVAFCAISIGVVAIGIGKAANAFGDQVFITGTLGVDVSAPGGISIRCTSGCK